MAKLQIIAVKVNARKEIAKVVEDLSTLLMVHAVQSTMKQSVDRTLVRMPAVALLDIVVSAVNTG